MTTHLTATRRKRVVIVGAGFGGVAEAPGLAYLPVEVTLVDQHDYHTFKPLVYQVATALLNAEDVGREVARHVPALCVVPPRYKGSVERLKMAVHALKAEPKNLHGFFSRDLSAVLTVDTGDTVRYETLDAGWGALQQAKTLGIPKDFAPRDRQRDFGHALTGPLAVRGAEPGMTLEVRVNRIRTGTWGWSAGPGLPSQMDERLGFTKAPSGPPAVITVPTGDQATMWSLEPNQGLAHNRLGQTLRMRPFMGVMGMPANEPGVQTTFPPRFCGGNLDCKELVEQSRLYLPIAVEGGLFSLGDGHAVQGDGEVAGPALACPMELVELEFHLHTRMHLSLPRAFTPAGWLTFGFHEDVNEAWSIATREMVQLIGEFYQLQPKEALALASLVMDLRITQVVNGVRGVHALLAHDAIDASKDRV